MLTILRIKNLALVADLSLEFLPGLNVITGETGAGKSILIGALNLVLGERADRTAIRSGSDACSVEAVFDISRLKAPLTAFLEENGLEPCDQNQLVLKRTFTTAGLNRQFVNGSLTTLQTLSTIGNWLVDIHGPHDHQSLLYPAKQLAILDAFGHLPPARERFAQLVRTYRSLERDKASLIVDERTYAQQLDLLRFQTHEIQSAKLQPGQESALQEEYHRASNAAKILQNVQQALAIIDTDDSALTSQFGQLGRALSELPRLDPSTASLVTLHEQIAAQLDELQTCLSRYADRVELDPARLHELEDRLNLIQSLKRKYGSTLEEVIAFGDQAKQKLRSLEERDAEVDRINRELDKTAAQLAQVGRQLTADRQKIIPKLRKAVEKQLADLGFKQSQFTVELKSTPADLTGAGLTPTGFDTIEFQFAPNPGEPPRPLRSIASSGELARVMLALKTVLAAQDDVPVLIFDEVDANVGGETAHAVGEKMRQIARQRQVLCITHLAPVAAAADAHHCVTKQVTQGRTVSEIALLDANARIAELTRMLGGQSPAARKHAEALLEGSKT